MALLYDANISVFLSFVTFFIIENRPVFGLQWRSSTFFILFTLAIGQFTDLFLYGLLIPTLPFLLQDWLHVPAHSTQHKIDLLLMPFSVASFLFPFPAGWQADWSSTRKAPYLMGLVALMAATAMFATAESYSLLVASRVFQGLSAAVVNAAGLGMMIDTVGPDRLGSAFGIVRSSLRS